MTKETTTTLEAVLNNYAKDEHLFDNENQAYELLTSYKVTGFKSENQSLVDHYKVTNWFINAERFDQYYPVSELIMTCDDILPDNISLKVLQKFNNDHDNETSLYISLIEAIIQCQEKIIACYNSTEDVQQYLKASNEINCKLMEKIYAYIETIPDEVYEEFYDYFD